MEGNTMDKMLKYSIQLAMLKQLLDKKLITELEHRKIKNQLMRDYNIVSDLCTWFITSVAVIYICTRHGEHNKKEEQWKYKLLKQTVL